MILIAFYKKKISKFEFFYKIEREYLNPDIPSKKIILGALGNYKNYIFCFSLKISHKFSLENGWVRNGFFSKKNIYFFLIFLNKTHIYLIFNNFFLFFRIKITQIKVLLW